MAFTIASLRMTRQKQEAELRSIVNAPSLGPPLVELYFDDLAMELDFIQKMLEVQVDFSEKLTTCLILTGPNYVVACIILGSRIA